MALIETNAGLWFQEDLYPEIACGFKVSAVLHRERSAFQDILAKTCGGETGPATR